MKKMKRFNKFQKTIFVLTIIVVLEFIGLCYLHHDVKNHECEVPVVKASETNVEPVVEEPEPEPVIQSLGIYRLTAYCPCKKCCGKTNGITASGTKATAGRTIAVARQIPFGTELIIDGHTYVAEDRGGAIKGNRIDIYFDTHQEALNFGVQYKEIFIKGVQ